jgi:hypothetical protein
VRRFRFPMQTQMPRSFCSPTQIEK